MVRKSVLAGLAVVLLAGSVFATDPVKSKTGTPSASTKATTSKGFTLKKDGPGAKSISLVVGWMWGAASLTAASTGMETLSYTHSDPTHGHTKFMTAVVTALSASAGIKVPPSSSGDVKTTMTYSVVRDVDGVSMVVLSNDITNTLPLVNFKFKTAFKTDVKFNFASVYFTTSATQTVITTSTSSATIDKLGFFGATGGTVIGFTF